MQEGALEKSRANGRFYEDGKVKGVNWRSETAKTCLVRHRKSYENTYFHVHAILPKYAPRATRLTLSPWISVELEVHSQTRHARLETISDRTLGEQSLGRFPNESQRQWQVCVDLDHVITA